MKKAILAVLVLAGVSACTGSYTEGKCKYDFLLHKDISISKIIGNSTGGCK